MPRDYQPRRWRAYLRSADTMTINANQASRFLSLLALDPAEPQTWQVFRDRLTRRASLSIGIAR
jgi:hypothetical protein